MVIRQEIKSHCRNFSKQGIERSCVSGRRDVIAMTHPYTCLVVPGSGNSKDHWLRHSLTPAHCPFQDVRPRKVPRARSTKLAAIAWFAVVASHRSTPCGEYTARHRDCASDGVSRFG